MVTHPDQGDGQMLPRATGDPIWAIPGEIRNKNVSTTENAREARKNKGNGKRILIKIASAH